jgi:hypothetical protein
MGEGMLDSVSVCNTMCKNDTVFCEFGLTNKDRVNLVKALKKAAELEDVLLSIYHSSDEILLSIIAADMLNVLRPDVIDRLNRLKNYIDIGSKSGDTMA